MLELVRLSDELTFPAPELALDEPNGLLAFGGDLCLERLVLAYHSGIFPWFSDNEPILWWSPDPRGIIELSEFRCSKSLLKFMRKTSFSVTLNNCFERVIYACAQTPRNENGTWITQGMCHAYIQLHYAGYAHSIEVWHQDELIGGLYGVLVGRVFCGESMFHSQSNASKLAFYHLVELAKESDLAFIDCQMQNPHLASLGCKEISREQFLTKLHQANSIQQYPSGWQARVLKP